MPLTTDYHMHTPLCQHALGPMEAYVERALEIGLQEIGFSCHNPLPNGCGANVRMKETELEYYVQRVVDLQFQYRGRLHILLGLEMDFVPGMEEYLDRQAQAYPWDYLIGSIHYLDPECRFGAWWREMPLEHDAHYVQYYRLVQQMMRSGLYDIIGHLDVVKRSGRLPGPRGAEELERTLTVAAQAGCCLEINTSGYRHTDAAVPGPYPALSIVEQMLKLGIPLVVNSDAHAPDQVGTNFPLIENWLKQHGCRQVARFQQRRREMCAL